MTCNAELCPFWTGQGCACEVFGIDGDSCHCGDPVAYGYASEYPTRHRGMCSHCDAVRCDAYPGECGR